MKIEDGKFVKLAALDIEDCFEYNGCLYTVVDEANVGVTHTIGMPRVLVLCLNDNKLLEYDPNTMVKRMDLKIVVE